MRKNVASQVVDAQLNSRTDGSPVTTGTTTVYVSGDGGPQVAVGGSPSCIHLGNGLWSYIATAAESSYDHVSFTFVNSAAVCATVQIYPSFPQTGDNYARIGAPAGASLSADVAAVKSDSAAIKTKTDFLPSATAGAAGGVFIAGSNAATSITTALTANVIGNVTGNLSGSVGSVTGNLGGNVLGNLNGSVMTDVVGNVNGAVTSVTGAVGSVTGNVGGNVNGSVLGDLAGNVNGVVFAVGSVTGNVGGNVVGNVLGSVGWVDVGGITAASFAAGAINAAAIATDAIDADAIKADAVTEIQAGLSTLNAAGVRTAVGLATANLDTQLGAIDDFVDTEVAAIKAVTDKLNTTMESTGSPTDYVFTARALAQAPTGGGTAPTVTQIADEVQTRTIAGVTLVATTTNLTNAPTNGDLTATMKASVTTAATVATPIAASVTGAVGSVAGNVGGNVVGSVGSVVGAVGSVTGGVTVTTNNDKTGYGLSSGERTTLAGVIWATVMEGSRTAIQYMRGFGAALLGKASGMATTTATFRDVDDSKDRIVATVDADGNRSAITLDLT